MFIVNLTYKVPLERVEELLEEHIQYLNHQYELGNFIASGRKIPRDGGIILSNMNEKAELQKVLDQDPFKSNDLADYQVIEFIPTKTSQELDFLKVSV